MKTCSKCRAVLPADMFPAPPSSWCKPCRATHARAQYAKNRASELARKANWRAENVAVRSAYNKAWRAANPDREREGKRIREAARRTRLRGGLVLKFTAEQLDARLSMFAGCWVCHGPADQADHVKPIAAGGGHLLANLRPICGGCNRRKRSKWPVDRNALARS